MTQKPKKIAVLKGGWSSEREVSLSSGTEVSKALREAGYEVVEIDVKKDLPELLTALDTHKPDVIFNALHGTGGEDGTIQGVLDMIGIPYTHSGLAASAYAMDKVKTKHILAMEGIPVAEDKTMLGDGLRDGHPMAAPYVIKPVAEGSSVGVFVVKNSDDTATLERALHALRGKLVMVERYIPGKELTVAVLEDENGVAEPLTITELQPKNTFYDYQAKYTDGFTEHIVGTTLPGKIGRALMDYAVLAHKTMGCCHVSRSDFRYNENDGIIFLEINTQPGMTSLSLLPEQAKHCGITFPQLVSQIVEAAYRGA